LISGESSYREYLARLAGEKRVALDTEADSLHCYFEKLCLIQSGWGQDAQSGWAQNLQLIDPLAGLPLEDFFEALKGKTILFHDADYDLRLLRRSGEFPDQDIFDTMIAARLCGEPQLGLAALVEKYFGVTLSKASRKANWAQRPLSDQMVEYALNDVRFLPQLADILAARLEELGRLEWYGQSRDRMIRGTRETRQRDEENLWRITGYAALPPRGWAILRSLWRWRDSEARLWDRPSFHVLSNENLLQLASEAAKGSKFSRPRLPQPRAGRMEEALEEALALPESQWPQMIRGVRVRASKEQIDRFNRLRDHRDRIARDLDLDPSILAPKAALEAVAADPAAAVLLPWQRSLLGLSPLTEIIAEDNSELREINEAAKAEAA
jgi:ribonuclease D